MNECNFCKSKFKSQYILKQHQKRAKYCLNIQNKNVNNFIRNVVPHLPVPDINIFDIYI